MTEVPAAISDYLEHDHGRIDDALNRAVSAQPFDAAAYAEFRGALLRHIGMEEKILFPAARAARGGRPLDRAERLHLDHGALAALLVPNPTTAILDAIRTILRRHNALEEGPDGVYAECERLTGFDIPTILTRLQQAPPVALAPHVDSPIAMQSLRAALQRAGYGFAI